MYRAVTCTTSTYVLYIVSVQIQVDNVDESAVVDLEDCTRVRIPLIYQMGISYNSPSLVWLAQLPLQSPSPIVEASDKAAT